MRLTRRTFAILSTTFLLAAAVVHAVEPFNGKDLSGWKTKGDAKRSKWVVGKAALAKNPSAFDVEKGDGELINAATGVDVYTEEKFGDCQVELEFMIPKGSNSGVYLMGEYEVQV